MNTFLRRRRCLCLELLEARCLPSTVTNLSDHDPGSLRDAIATTPSGGTVDFQPGLRGTITLTTGELAINKDLNFEGPGADVITVSGNKASRVFDIASFTVAISELTVADGMVTSEYGGGIYNDGTLTITACTFSGNSAFFGGGLSNVGTLTITASTFSGNSADYSMLTNGLTYGGDGGGIDNGGTLTISASTFSSNSGNGTLGEGGGIDNHGTLTISASTFSSNSANGTLGVGGGIDNVGTLTVTDSTFSRNSANGQFGQGGGIYTFGGTLTISESTFSRNSANGQFGQGGGILNGGMLTIRDSTFSRNSAWEGGGIYNFPGGNGNPSGTVKIRNTLLAGNSSQSGGPDVDGGLTSLGHNLIGDGSDGKGYVATDLVGSAANPIDPKLGPLQDNGGPTWTMALLPGSPAIGAGSPTDSEWDQRGPGYARSVNGLTDIGSYEVQPSGSSSAALTLHLPEPTRLRARDNYRRATQADDPITPVAAAVDRVLASWVSEAMGLVTERSKDAAVSELVLWPFDPLPV